jgi:hypothetical protein
LFLLLHMYSSIDAGSLANATPWQKCINPVKLVLWTYSTIFIYIIGMDTPNRLS